MARGSDGETLSAATGSVGVRIVKHKSLAIQSSRELQFGANEVEKTLAVYNDRNPIVFKPLVAFELFVVEGQFIHQTAAATTLDTHSDEAPFGGTFLGHQVANLVAGILVDSDHAVRL